MARVKAGKASNITINNIIDSHVEFLSNNNMINQNFIYWPIIGKWIWPNSFVGNTYEEEITFLKEWIDRRLSWLDQHMGFLKVLFFLGEPPKAQTSQLIQFES